MLDQEHMLTAWKYRRKNGNNLTRLLQRLLGHFKTEP